MFPPEQKAVAQKLKILTENLFYPSLRTKKVQGINNVFEMSVNMDIRILWRYENGVIILLLGVRHHKDMLSSQQILIMMKNIFIRRNYFMRVNIKTTEAIFPMPVLLVATYNEDGSVDVMNAAWGTMLERDHVILNLTETHKTVQNIKARKAFTVSIADAAHVTEADYFGVVSGNNTPDKFANSGLTAEKSTLVDAPVINEFPICMECEFIEYQDDQYGCGVIGKVVNVTADESVMDGNSVDIEKVSAIAFDPYTHGYYKVTERVGNAFQDGLQLKK